MLTGKKVAIIAAFDNQMIECFNRDLQALQLSRAPPLKQSRADAHKHRHGPDVCTVCCLLRDDKRV